MKKLACALLVLLPLTAVAQTAKETWSINGQVLDENGKPVAGAGVHAYPDALSGRVPMAVTDSEGRFTVQVRKTGRYRVGAWQRDLGYPSTVNPFYYPATAGSEQVMVNPNAPPPFITLRFAPRAGRLKIRVSEQATNEPLQSVQISLCRADAPRHCYRQNLSARDGVFSTLTSSDRVFVEVYAEGHEDKYVVNEREHKPQVFTVASNTIAELNVALKKRSPQDVEGLLKAPEQLSPEDGTELVHFPRTTELAWKEVPGAASYAVEIDICNGVGVPDVCKSPSPLYHMDMAPTSGIEGTTYKFIAVGAQPYRWRVWAIDRDGNPGRKSAWALFFYRM